MMFFPFASMAACSDGRFSSENKQPAAKIAAQSTDSSAQPQKSETPPHAGNQPATSTDKVLDVCLKEFNVPNILTEKVIAETKYETVNLPNANNSVIYSDSVATAGPAIIRITIDSRNANKGILELKNPNGYCCVNYTGAVVNNFTVSAECSTKFVILDLNYRRSSSFDTQQPCK